LFYRSCLTQARDNDYKSCRLVENSFIKVIRRHENEKQRISWHY